MSGSQAMAAQPHALPPAQLVPVPRDAGDAERAMVLRRCMEAAAAGRRAVLLPARQSSAGTGSLDLSWAAFLRCEVIMPVGVSLEPVAGLRVIGTWELLGDEMQISMEGGGQTRQPALGESVWQAAPSTLRSRRRSSIAFGIGMAVTVAVGAFLTVGSRIDSPYIVVQPTPPRPASELVQPARSAAPGSAFAGLMFPTIGNRRARWSEMPLWWLRKDHGVDVIKVDGTMAKRLESSDTAEFDDSRRFAVMAAWHLARRPLSGSGLLVRKPAPGTGLKKGDVIVGADGKPVRQLRDLAKIIDRRTATDVIDLELASGRKGATLWLFPDPVMPDGFQLSVLLSENVPWEQHPASRMLTLPQLGVGGGSAGLATALASYQHLTGSDLIRGRTVVATGSVDALGRVWAVEGVGQKARAARDAGADVLLVPVANVPDTGQYLGGDYGDMQVISVESLDAAVTALKLPTPRELCGDCT